MNDASIAPPPVGRPTRERHDENQIETVRRAVALEDLERIAGTERFLAIRSDEPAGGWARPAAWMALGMLSACGFISLMMVASRGTAGARDWRPPGEREPKGAERRRQRAPTTTERGEFRQAETWRERAALDEDAAPAGRARQPPQKGPALDGGCRVRVAGTDVEQEEPRRPPPMARSYGSSDDRRGSWSRKQASKPSSKPPSKPFSKPSSEVGPPHDAVTEPAPLRPNGEAPAAPASFRPQAPNDSPVLL